MYPYCTSNDSIHKCSLNLKQKTPTVDKHICQSRRHRINTQDFIEFYKEIFHLGNCLQSQPAIKDFHKVFSIGIYSTVQNGS